MIDDLPHSSIHQMFSSWALENPDAPAVMSSDGILTYGALDEWSNRLAAALQQRGVTPGDWVAIRFSTRTQQALAIILAILKCGAAYVPIDPSTPIRRMKLILSRVSPRCLVSEYTDIEEAHFLQVKCFSMPELERSVKALSTGTRVDDASCVSAYMVFTSGTTGPPKGVMVRHSAVINMALEQRRLFGVCPHGRILQFFSISFDASVFEIFMALLNGASLVMPARQDLMDVQALCECIREFKVSSIQLPPAILGELPNVDLESVETVFIGGETYPLQTVARWASTHRVINVYGPTEATCWVTFNEISSPVTREDVAIIGQPIAGAKVYVLDQQLRPVPIGDKGELCIGGVGVSEGYFDHPLLTSERFLSIPALDSGILYRTGDLASFLPDGRLRFHGRLDRQTKVRGFRVELGEVENCLCEHPLVREAAVVPRWDGQLVVALDAHVALEASSQVDASTLKVHIRERLPHYMTPATVHFHDELPRSASGKIDHQVLNSKFSNISSLASLTVETTQQNEVLTQWIQVIGSEPLSLDHGFFESGGNSIDVFRLISRLHDCLGKRLTMREFLRASSVRELASLFSSQSGLATMDADVNEVSDEHCGLAPAQQRIWHLAQLKPKSYAYNIGYRIIIDGPCDHNELIVAVERAVARHPVLTAAIRDDRMVLGAYEFEVARSSIPGSASGSVAQTLFRHEISRPIQLFGDPLFRVRFLRFEDAHCELLIVAHHIIFDGWSVGVLSNDIAQIYNNRPQPQLHGKSLINPYFSYAKSHSQLLAEAEGVRLREYWANRLSCDLAFIEFPERSSKDEKLDRSAIRLDIDFSLSLTVAVRQLAEQMEITPCAFFLAVYRVLLGRWAPVGDERELLIATVAAGRVEEQLERAVGFFVSTLPLIIHMRREHSFRRLAHCAFLELAEAQDHQALPWDQILVAAGREQQASKFAQAMFVFQNAPMGAPELLGAKVRLEEVPTQLAMFDIHLEIRETAEQYTGWLEVAEGTLNAVTASAFIQEFQTLCQLVCATPDAPLETLPVWYDTSPASVGKLATLPEDSWVPDRFEAQVQRTPDAVALSCDGRKMSYLELAQQSAILSDRLLASGAGPGRVVAVKLERSIDLVVSLLAVLRAGAAYVPIEPAFPFRRRAAILRNCQAVALITTSELADENELLEVSIIHVDRIPPPRSTAPWQVQRTRISEDDLAYVIFTSGSTGAPKGAMNTHGGLRNRLLWMQRRYRLDPTYDVVLQKTPFTFDVSVWEFFWPLTEGASLVLASPGGHLDIAYLRRLIIAERITIVHFVPSMMRLYLDVADHDSGISLRLVFSSGEALSADTVQRFSSHLPAVELHNLYGPSEAAIDVSAYMCWPRRIPKKIPIGRAIDNVSLYLLDAHMNPVPHGSVGHLYIGGAGVGLGYIGQPELTREKFRPDPFVKKAGARMYQTGDLAYRQSDGEIIFLGRVDTQIKLNGQRIELGEIETELRHCENVLDAGVIGVDLGTDFAQLEAYVVPTPGVSLNIDEISRALKMSLPLFMVPKRVLVSETLPYTSSGKLDRIHLLRQRNAKLNSKEYPVINELGVIGEKVRDIWREIFPNSSIDDESDFFSIGGTSILATRLVLSIRKSMGVDLPVRSLFEFPTISGLTHAIMAISASTSVMSSDEVTEVDLLSSARLPADIVPAPGEWSDGTPRRVLLTGATGFLGYFILKELLENSPELEVFCLVRADSTQAAEVRLHETIAKYGLLSAELMRRVIVLKGDVSVSRFGMSTDAYIDLASSIDAVVHSAAWVNFIEPYKRLHGSNVKGTEEVLRFSCLHKTKVVHLVSSSSVFGTVGFSKDVRELHENQDIRIALGFHYGGYVKSKWAAEWLAQQALDRGVPISIYRCGLILGHSESGVANVNDFPSLLIKGCVQLGATYRLHQKFDDFVPVDYASRAIAYLVCRPERSVGRAFHVVNPERIEYGDFWHLIARHGYQLEELNFSEWVFRILRDVDTGKGNALYPLLPLFLEKLPPMGLTVVEMFQKSPVYSTTQLDEALRGSGIVCPCINQNLVSAWLDFYQRTDFLARPDE